MLQPSHSRPTRLVFLAAPPKRAPPEVRDVMAEGGERAAVGRHGVIVEPSPHDRSQPLALHRYRLMQLQNPQASTTRSPKPSRSSIYNLISGGVTLITGIRNMMLTVLELEKIPRTSRQKPVNVSARTRVRHPSQERRRREQNWSSNQHRSQREYRYESRYAQTKKLDAGFLRIL